MAAMSSPSCHSDSFYQQLSAYLTDLQASLQQGLAPAGRLSCLITLREYWQHGFMLDDFSETILDVAQKLSDWPLLIQLLLKIRYNGLTSDNALSLAEAYYLMGNINAARHTLATLLLAQPYHQQCHDYWKWMCAAHAFPHLQDEELRLTPLTEHHLQAFSWQYSESVKDLCNLPDFSSVTEWHELYQWMLHDTNRVILAVIHEQWGFIGCVHLQVYDGIGFFYYWLGDDFQGQGLGPRAVNLLLDYGYRHMGMNCCYAKVFQRNKASHKAIKKLGFQQLPFDALAPYDDEIFYYWGNPHKKTVLLADLQYLLMRMESLIEVVPHKLQINF